MSSKAYQEWIETRSKALDEMAQAHTAVGGIQRGRRYATQQINQSYAVLIAAQFQGFCRDLHSECVDSLVVNLVPASTHSLMTIEFTWNRQLDHGNAKPSSLRFDFGRLGIDVWPRVDAHAPTNARLRSELESLNLWRNAIVHQDLDPAKLGGTTLRLSRVKKWRRACTKLARSLDEVMRQHLKFLTGVSPW